MKKLTPILLLILGSVGAHSTQAKEGYHHFPEIFIGATHFDNETNFTYALEYEYKFNPKFGAGLIYERTENAHHGDGVTLKIAALYYHPVSSFRLGIGYGEEKVGGEIQHTEELYRVVASYDYHFENFSVAPTLAFDFIDGETATVFGLGFIKPF